jgi:hypothetical protein
MPIIDAINTIARGAALVSCCFFIGGATAAEPQSADNDPSDPAVQAPLPPDPLANTLRISPSVTGPGAKAELSRMLPPRTDSPFDWHAGIEPLYECGEPRWLPPCIPPPPCHPSFPPHPFDLVGARGMPTSGPRYLGPCCPKTGTHDDGPLPWVHRMHDRSFDWFYRTK